MNDEPKTNKVSFAKNLPIGAFAAMAGVNVETIRFYQRRGLLPDRINRPAASGATANATWRGCVS